jgi:hypothetical protein
LNTASISSWRVRSFSYVKSAFPMAFFKQPLQLHSIGIELNILRCRKQLPANEVQRGRSIASLRIHMERAIGLTKQVPHFFAINGSHAEPDCVCLCMVDKFPSCTSSTSYQLSSEVDSSFSGSGS